MADSRTWYEVLGVTPSAGKGEVKAAYQSSMETAEHAENADEVAQVRRAWQVLSDPIQRQRYDEEIGLNGRRASGATQVPDDNGYDGDIELVDDDEEFDDDGDPLAPPKARHPKPSMMLEAAEFLELPTLGRRLTASMVDAITLVAVYVGSIAITFQVTGADHGLPAVLIFVGWLEFWFVVLLVIPTFRTGQTLGKRFTYLMCVDRATGNLCSLRQVLIRYVAAMFVIPLLVPMGAFLALFYGLSYAMGRDQVSLADRIAKTAVVIARYRPTRPGRAA